MYVLLVSIHVAPEEREQFLAAARGSDAVAVRGNPLVLRFDIVQDAEDENHFFYFEQYATEADFLTLRATPEMTRWRQAAGKCVGEGGVSATVCTPVVVA
jgi:autoinducer 2-degrading protein